VAAVEAGGRGEDRVRDVGGVELLKYLGRHGGCCGKTSELSLETRVRDSAPRTPYSQKNERRLQLLQQQGRDPACTNSLGTFITLRFQAKRDQRTRNVILLDSVIYVAAHSIVTTATISLSRPNPSKRRWLTSVVVTSVSLRVGAIFPRRSQRHRRLGGWGYRSLGSERGK
jgi:hypothetical protein